MYCPDKNYRFAHFQKKLNKIIIRFSRVSQHISGVRSLTTTKKKKKKTTTSKIIQKSSGVRRRSGSRRERRGANLSRGVWLSRTVGGKGLFRLLVTRDIKVKVQARIDINNLPLESKPPRSPLSAGLIPQTRYGSVPLNNQSFLPLKVPSQPMALLGQVFNRAHRLGSFVMSSI